MISLRGYQHDAVEAAWGFLCNQSGNPVLSMPTGSGKSLVIAQLCRDAVTRWQGRVVVLAHRKELLQQNAAKIKALLPDMDIGIYSAGLKSRDTDHDIIVAGIQSVYGRAHDFGRRNLCVIDEAHLVPFSGEGMYRTFLDDLRSANSLRIVGLTATPFRLEGGPLCRPDSVFNKVAYSTPIQNLIADGYLCRLTTKPSATQIDTSALHIRGGDFVQYEAENLFSVEATVKTACAEVVRHASGRHSVLVFCSGVSHAAKVAAEIERLTGEPCGLVTGETLALERSATLSDFQDGRLRWLTNVDVLTTGFDAPNIDCIAILRATMSAGLYAQIVGRGFRVHPSKTDCLVLDFGNNIERHGPVDALDYGRCKDTGAQPGEAPVKTCPNCEHEVFAGAAECHDCGFKFPPKEARHDDQADQANQILSEPETFIVNSMAYFRHEKKGGGIPTLRVDYFGKRDGETGNVDSRISEWVCLEHNGFAGQKAALWWKARSKTPVPANVDDAAKLCQCGAVATPRSITAVKEGRWYRIIAADLDEKPEEWSNEAYTGVDPWDNQEEMPF